MRLDERHASRAACLSCGLCAQLTWPSRYLCTMRAGELGRRTILAGWRAGFCTPPKWSGAPVRPAAWWPGRGRSILGTVSLHHSIVWPCPRGTFLIANAISWSYLYIHDSRLHKCSRILYIH